MQQYSWKDMQQTEPGMNKPGMNNTLCHNSHCSLEKAKQQCRWPSIGQGITSCRVNAKQRAAATLLLYAAGLTVYERP
jgi:hypothetical protein